jgi:hypothetical protein
MVMATRSGGPVYQLKVTLKGVRPPIWRRLLVPGNVTLARLHRILQVAMGWEDYHLYRFEVGGASFGEPDPEFDDDMRSARRVHLKEVAPAAGSRLLYEYDFGDGWEHRIVVEKILPPQRGVHLPVCLAGKRACPPEDCGGVWGYADLLAALADPAHPEHEAMLRWVGGPFDPEAFDLEAVNEALALE